MERDIVEFVLYNKEAIKAHLSTELYPLSRASEVFQNNPDIQSAYIQESQVRILTTFLMEQFPSINFEEMACVINVKFLEYLK